MVRMVGVEPTEHRVWACCICQFYYIHRSSVRATYKAERIAQGVSDKGNLEWRCCPDGWCKRRDSNPYANAAASKTAMSAYSITLAWFNFKHRKTIQIGSLIFNIAVSGVIGGSGTDWTYNAQIWIIIFEHFAVREVIPLFFCLLLYQLSYTPKLRTG